MSRSYIIYENEITQERLQVEAPLQCLANVEDLRRELAIPNYTDINEFQMRKSVVALWASQHPDKVIEAADSQPLRVALFGGGGFKLHCPSANVGPFSRKIGDVDLITLKENGKQLVGILCKLGEKFGNMFFHGIANTDKRFNALRAKMRYRLRTIKDIDEDGTPIPGLIDVFCDRLTFCHTLDLRDELNKADKNRFTIGLENMLISKAQLIKVAAKDAVANVDQNRILGEYEKGSVLIGMETKDMKDVAAALLDHDLGQGEERIDIDVMGRKLRQDWGTWKTVTLNLKNMQQRSKPITDAFGAEKEQQEIVDERLAKIVEQLEGKYAAKRTFSFNKQWWESVEEQVI